MGPQTIPFQFIIVIILALLPFQVGLAQKQVPIVQPGAPGEPSRRISAEEASDLASIRFSAADIQFVQGMISHHAQALEMTALLTSQSDSDLMRRLAKRIELSQEDEIIMMQEWLRSRDQDVTSVDAYHAHDAELMPGMLTQDEMTKLKQAAGVEFDRLFLEHMITHHRGALTMVEDLLAQHGAAQDSALFAFTSDITADQSMEIDRMDAMLAVLSPDPRVNLKAGFLDAGEAILHLERVATLPKPDGFFDPHAPAGRATPKETQSALKAEKEVLDKGKKDAPEDEPADALERPGILDFANTDFAFSGDILYEGNYHGFNTYNVEDPSAPQLLSSVVCPGGQGDLSVVGNILIMSVEQTRGRLDCGLEGVAEPISDMRFRGLRIFDITDVRMPRQVAAVQTCRGSHTHTVVSGPDDEGNIYVYGSGTGSVRPGEELESCSDARPAEDPNSALFSIDVIQIPIARPEDASLVNRPRVFSDAETGAIAGLWKGGDHGPGTQKSRETDQCHDITVYPELGIAAGACAGNGILMDVSDPANPIRLDHVVDPGFAYWHSATFNNTGDKVVFTDEWSGGGRPRCRASDPKEWGANAIFDIVDGKLEFRSYYKMPAPQTEQENCVAHNGSLLPVPGRDIMVQAWYQGGISIFDFTDSSKPIEIAFFDRGPIHETRLITGGYWSAYWYNGYIYGTEIARGLDVLKLLPSIYLSQNEIDAATLVTVETLNAQQQQSIEWPNRPSVARAYLDQLDRSKAIPVNRSDTLKNVLDRIEEKLATGEQDELTLDQLNVVASDLTDKNSTLSKRDLDRVEALVQTLQGISKDLR